MEKIILKLNELKTEMESLKKLHHSQGRERYSEIYSLLKRIIDRIYPEKDAKDLKRSLSGIPFAANYSDAEEQKDYLDGLDRKIRVVNTILEEHALLGFDDFKPIKEKIETEANIKTGFFNFGRKTIKEK